MRDSKDHEKTSFVFKTKSVTCTLYISVSGISLSFAFKKSVVICVCFFNILTAACFSVYNPIHVLFTSLDATSY